MAKDIEEKKTEILIFPEDLDNNRYLIINFYEVGASGSKAFAELNTSITNVLGSISKGIELEGTQVADNLKTAFKSGIEVVKNAGSTAKQGLDAIGSGQRTAKAPLESSKIAASIVLPIPNNLNESINHSWEEKTGIATSLLGNMLGPSSLIGQTVEATAALTGTRNVVLNPDYHQMYSGTRLRGLQLSWSFTPRSKKESEELTKIIATIKKYSAPHISNGGAFLSAPYFTKVKFRKGDKSPKSKLDLLLNFDALVVKDISVNYAEEGMMEMFEDGYPKFINFTISFGERRMKTFSDWDYKDIAN